MSASPARGALTVALLLYSASAAARVTVGPYLQDAKIDGAMVVFDTDTSGPAEVVVDEEHHFKSPPGVHHEVRVSGLAPGRHRYVVHAGDVTVPPVDFATLPTGNDLDFIVYGDNRDRDADHARVIAAMQKEHADLLLQTGDMTGDAGVDALWLRFFAVEQPLLASVPMYPTLGNHELLHDPTAAHFHHYFSLPGPDAIEDVERYYAFRVANTLFIALDGNLAKSHEQARWLGAQLDGAAADNGVRHVFVFFHQPPFSAGEQCGSAAELGLWVPEFERPGREKIRAIFSGHEHCYEHLERNGVRYFVLGGGGAPLVKQSAHCPKWDVEALRKFESVHHFARVRVRGESVVFDAIAASGELIESVQLDAPKPADPAPPTAVPYHAVEAAVVASNTTALLSPEEESASRDSAPLVRTLAALMLVVPVVWLVFALLRRKKSRKHP